MVTRLRLTLEQTEYSALLALASSELRNPSDQARHIIRETLQQSGLLDADKYKITQATANQAEHEDN